MNGIIIFNTFTTNQLTHTTKLNYFTIRDVPINMRIIKSFIINDITEKKHTNDI